MKTLVYRHNPLIHISAPEIKEADFAGNINYVIETNGEPFNLHFHKEDWTLVEEEPVDLEKTVEFGCICKKVKMTVRELINYYIDSECADVADECGF